MSLPKYCMKYLREGEKQFFTKQRTIHPQYQHPRKRLKEYQRKQFYIQKDDEDIQIIDLDNIEQVAPVKKIQQKVEEKIEEIGPQNNQEGQIGQNAEAQPNIDDIPLQGQQGDIPPQQQEPQQIIDKLKPKIKVYCNPKQVKINKRYQQSGYRQILLQKQYNQRKFAEDVQFGQIGVQWAKSKSRAQTARRRRSESASTTTRRLGIPVMLQRKQSNIQNLINFQNIKPVQVNRKGSRPVTAINLTQKQKKKDQIIKNAFITGRLDSHVTRQCQKTSLKSMTILGEKPKRKTFQQILIQAEDKVYHDAIQQIENVKETFAKNKISLGVNRIAKSITYYNRQLEGDNFVGMVTGLALPKNPFMKTVKKKKKKKKN